MTFAANKESQSITINNRHTIHGNVTFANKAMNLVIADGATVLIFGDLSISNKIDLNSGGTLVVTGTLNKSGNQGSFTGDGRVYAGTYSGSAEDFVPGDVATADQQQSLDELETDNTDGSLDEVINAINNGTSLPIVLKYFQLSQTQDGVTLDWATLSEENFHYFEVQRANSDGQFETIAEIEGNGNTSDEITYSWTDHNPLEGINYYRLESVDFDGYREVFSTTAITHSQEHTQFSIYPNHIKENGILSLSGISDARSSLTFVDRNGKTVYQSDLIEASFKLPDTMGAGVYILIYQSAEMIQTQRLIVR